MAPLWVTNRFMGVYLSTGAAVRAAKMLRYSLLDKASSKTPTIHTLSQLSQSRRQILLYYTSDKERLLCLESHTTGRLSLAIS